MENEPPKEPKLKEEHLGCLMFPDVFGELHRLSWPLTDEDVFGVNVSCKRLLEWRRNQQLSGGRKLLRTCTWTPKGPSERAPTWTQTNSVNTNTTFSPKFALIGHICNVPTSVMSSQL